HPPGGAGAAPPAPKPPRTRCLLPSRIVAPKSSRLCARSRTLCLETVAQTRCPLGSKADIRTAKKPCPLYSQKRTCAVQLGMSALGLKRTLAAAHKSSFLPMRIATISAPIRLANVGNYSLGVVVFDPERSN